MSTAPKSVWLVFSSTSSRTGKPVISLSSSLTSPSSWARSIDVRQLQPDNPALKRLPLSDTVLRDRFEQNALGYGAFQLMASSARPYVHVSVSRRHIPTLTLSAKANSPPA